MALTYSQMSKKSTAKFGWVSKAESANVRRAAGMAPGSFNYAKAVRFKCMRGVDLLLIKTSNGCCFQLIPTGESPVDWSKGLQGVAIAHIRLTPAPGCAKTGSIKRIISGFNRHFFQGQGSQKRYLKVEFDRLGKIHPEGYAQKGIRWL